MKAKGSFSQYRDQRNFDLITTYRSVLRSTPPLTSNEIYKMVVSSSAGRFYVGEERATMVISRMLKGDMLISMSEQKREMYREIYRRVLEQIELNPGMPLCNIVIDVVSQPAPKFYLTPQSAKIIIHQIKARCREKRRERC